MAFFFLLVFLVGTRAEGQQVYPPEGTELNFIVVPLSVPGEKGVSTYTFQVAEGIIDKESDFATRTTLSETTDANRAVVRLPRFGDSYTWQVVYKDKGKQVKKSPLYHFSTVRSRLVNTEIYRQKVVSNTYPDKGLSYFIDNARVLYDMEGKPLWVLPDIPPYVVFDSKVRDLKATPFNTITFLTDYGAYEVSYDGKMLWMAPNSGEVDGVPGAYRFFHHEFTRLKNGNYMLLAMEKVLRKMPAMDTLLAQRHPDVVRKDTAYYKNVEFGTIVEYNAQKDIVWKWSSADYFHDDELFHEREMDSTFLTNTHLNAFFFDEQRRVIYAGFRDKDRVISIAYPGKKIMAEYGAGTPTGRLFVHQHSVVPDLEGNLVIFNNNNPSIGRAQIAQPAVVQAHANGSGPNGQRPPRPGLPPGAPTPPGRLAPRMNIKSSVVVINQPVSAQDTAKKVWEFICDIDSLALPGSVMGGNAAVLEDGSLMVCMGTSHRTFIVNNKGKVLYNSLTEQRPPEGDEWAPYPAYRANPLSAVQLSKLATSLVK